VECVSLSHFNLVTHLTDFEEIVLSRCLPDRMD